MAGTLTFVNPQISVQSQYNDTTGGAFYGAGFLRAPGFNAGGVQIPSALAVATNCDLLGFVAGQSITSGTPVVIDLTTTLKQADGVTVANFASIGGFALRYNGPTGTLTWGGGANPWTAILNAATGTIIWQPGMTLAVLNPTPDNIVTSGSSKVMNFVQSAGTATFDLMVWGRSAL